MARKTKNSKIHDGSNKRLVDLVDQRQQHEEKRINKISSAKLWKLSAVSTAVVAILLGFFLQNNGKRDKEEALMHWIRENEGFVHENIVIRNEKELRGIFVDADLQKDETFLNVPEECFFSIKAIRDGRTVFSKIVQSAAGLLEGEIEPVQLALALMGEMKFQNSFWRPYLDLLPPTHPDQPLFWNDQQLQELQSPIVLSQIQQSTLFLKAKLPLLRTLASRYGHQLNFPQNDEQLLDEFIWSYYTVISRSFEVPGDRRDLHGKPDPNDYVTGLVPFADLLNHAFGPPTAQQKMTISSSSKKRSSTYYNNLIYISSATTNLMNNTELVWKYHMASEGATTKNLLRYGMVDSDLQRSATDYVVIHQQQRQKHWFVSSSGSILGWNEQQAQEERDDTLTTQELVPEVQAAIDALPTSLEEDRTLSSSVSSSSSSTNVTLRSTLLFRIRYKQILHKLLAWLNAGTPPMEDQVDQDFERVPSLAMIQINVS